jgi:hypothetical protein
MNKIRETKLNQHICEWCEDNREESNISEQEIQDFAYEKGGDIKIKTMLCQDCYYMYDQQMAYAAAS